MTHEGRGWSASEPTREHPAARARLVSTGLSASGTLVIVGGMVLAAHHARTHHTRISTTAGHPAPVTTVAVTAPVVHLPAALPGPAVPTTARPAASTAPAVVAVARPAAVAAPRSPAATSSVTTSTTEPPTTTTETPTTAPVPVTRSCGSRC